MSEVIYDTWMYTWPELEQFIKARYTVCDLRGYMISSKDRRCETPTDMSNAFKTWEKDVIYAQAGGKTVPPKVLEYHKQLNGVKPKDVLIDTTALEVPVIEIPRFTWSYSALVAFENCPLSSAHSRYYKDVPWSETPELVWGNRVHTALENILKGKAMTGDELLVAPYKKYTDMFLSARGELHAEKELAITEDLKPCDWFDAKAWGRCKIDVTLFKDGTVHVFDWKGLALDTPLPTPTGWTTMGEVQEGDLVLGGDGKPCRVVGKSEVHNRVCYELTFEDGSKVVCDDQHLWATEAGPKHKREVLNIEDIIDSLDMGHRIATTLPLVLPEAVLPLHPYVLGCWLGDGKHTDGTICNPEEELFAHIRACGYEVGEPHGDGGSNKCPSRTIYGIRGVLADLGVLGNKHIPKQYLRASFLQRVSLLQGICDTDGSANPIRNSIIVTTVKEQFAYEVQELVLSLGIKCKVFRLNKHGFGKDVVCYDIVFSQGQFEAFKLRRKAEKLDRREKYQRNKHRAIRSIEEIPTVPTQCIAVDSADNLYLCGREFIPTHNTGKVKNDELQLIVCFIFLALHYPEIQEFGGKFIWLKHDKVTGLDKTLSRQELLPYMQDVITRVQRFRTAWDTETFPAKPSGLCPWCGYKDRCKYKR